MDIKRSGYIEKFNLKLAVAFEIIDIGPMNFYLRLKVERD